MTTIKQWSGNQSKYYIPEINTFSDKSLVMDGVLGTSGIMADVVDVISDFVDLK